MTVVTQRALPVNWRNRTNERELLEELEHMHYEEGDEIDKMINRAEAHIAPQAIVQAVARLN